MEKIAGDMSGLLHDTLENYQELKIILVAEKKYIIDMDVDKLWASTDKKKSLVQSIEVLMETMLDRVRNHVSHFEMDLRSFNLRAVVSALPLKMKIKSQFNTLGLRIDALKEEIARLAHENKRYIVEYLGVIDGIFNTIQQVPARDQYSASGQVVANKEVTRLIHTEV